MAGRVGVVEHLGQGGTDVHRVRHALSLDPLAEHPGVHARHEHRRAAHDQRGEEARDLPGVVDEGQRVELDHVLVHELTARPVARGAHVLGVKARNDLGHAGGAARELEGEHVLGADLDAGQPRPGLGQAHGLDERLEAAGAGPGRAARHDDLPDAGVVRGQPGGKAGEIERAEVRLDEVRRRLGASGELPHLDLAMLRQGAHGNQASLEAAEQCDRGVDDGAHLEQGAVAGRQAELEECGAEALGRLVELRVGEATLLRDERPPGGRAPRCRSQHVTGRAVEPGAARAVARGIVVGQVRDTGNGKSRVGHFQ